MGFFCVYQSTDDVKQKIESNRTPKKTKIQNLANNRNTVGPGTCRKTQQMVQMYLY